MPSHPSLSILRFPPDLKMTLLSPDLSLGLTSTHVLITGGAGLIGSVVVSHFLATGSRVSSLDISYTSSSVPPHENCTVIPCDISSEPSIKTAFATAVEKNGPVEVCVALASLDLSVLKGTSFVDADFGQLKKVLDVNVAGTWLTSREWLRGLKKVREQGEDGGKKLRNVALVIIGSESGHFGERGWVDYSMGKSAVQGGLLMSLRAEVGRVWEGARVCIPCKGLRALTLLSYSLRRKSIPGEGLVVEN
ncbi:hypothetical protein BCR34DRAFT_580464 [Clohesyomyces aquaticus]|uniref:NAD(P)-binding protein n=1 Tax=Clohesyomyces aquaticus TaxID=1231657 RepID=A0A1Y1Y711_9PLEO|nr:hypothetical protein BCR34DRAFT_580464 [Clohesyomyces aquaticus]